MKLPEVLAFASLRLKVLRRQRIGVLLPVGAALLLLLALAVARVSYLRPQQIFWDFILALQFVSCVLLSTLLGSHMLKEERERRTLQGVLAGPHARASWWLGQGLGMLAAIAMFHVLLAVVGCVLSLVFFSVAPTWLIVQAQILILLEAALLLSLSMLLSLWLRPFLSFLATLAYTLFSHSLSELARVLSDPQSGAWTDSAGVGRMMWLSALLPPLEWFDLKSLVGYAPSALGFGSFLALCFLALLWSALFVLVGNGRFERMDL